MQMFDLTGKVAVITGSSKGIGRSIAECMARAGAKVVISSRKLDACENVAQGIRDAGGEAIAVACNVSRREDLENLIAQPVNAWGRV
ncbi:MAG: SDR family NAD(P)-dependent oxidoreductase, partial [Planctomycetaceae bacterium]|nr:SDR family NAD(P)-dependent oxidoreductase [Planctomycetaceae bacterium]